MRYALFLYFGLIILDTTKCFVSNRTKSGSNDKFSEDVFVKESGDVENSVYLEDVLFALNHQNWTEEEQPCLNQSLHMLKSLQNFTLWAVWEWDSVASQPQGLLYGSRYALGNFDECMNPPWTTHTNLNTHYCIADIVLERTDNAVRTKMVSVQPYQSALDFMQHRPPNQRPINEITWGACVPAVCQPQSVKRLMQTMLARSYLGMAGIRPNISITESCQDNQPRKFDGPFYAFVIVMTSLTLIAIICTYLNLKFQNQEPETVKQEIIKAFCLKENAADLLRMKKAGIEVLYGIRYLSICFIVVDHQVALFNGSNVSDGTYFDKVTLSILGLFMLHDDLFVDTFFFLSGFLTAVSLNRFKRLPNPVFIILKRYVRLVVAFAVVVFFVATVFPYTGSGPLWNKGIESVTTPCRKNWWLSLLMLNNYINSEDICIVVSWYIPCDFHFFVITVLVYWVYKRAPRFAYTCAGVISIAAIIVPGIINYLNDLPPLQLFTFEFVKNPRASEQFQITYIKSHTRFAAYIIGVFGGFTFAWYSATGNIMRISKKWATLGTIAGLTTMTVIMVIGVTYLHRSSSTLENAVYAAINRPGWTCGIAMVVLCCALGHVPLVKGFLSWYSWVPLSRLSYGLYLTHTVLILRNIFVSRNPQHNDYTMLLTSSAGVIVLGCVFSFIIWLIAEAPINKLFFICLKPRGNRSRQISISNNEKTQGSKESVASTSASSSHGYFSTNIPITVQLSSSKM